MRLVAPSENNKEEMSQGRFFRTDDRLIKALLILLVVNLVVLNGLLVWAELNFDSFEAEILKPTEITVLEEEDAVVSEENRDDVGKEIGEDEKEAVVAQSLCPASPELSYTPLVPVSTRMVQHLEEINFPGARGTNSTTWWNVPGMEVTFNIDDYPNYTAYWEALLRIKDGAGEAWARIYDLDANTPVVGSEIKTSSNTLVRISSGQLKFWSGKRNYRVQLKSLLDPEAVVEDAKIKINWIEEK